MNSSGAVSSSVMPETETISISDILDAEHLAAYQGADLAELAANLQCKGAVLQRR